MAVGRRELSNADVVTACRAAVVALPRSPEAGTNLARALARAGEGQAAAATFAEVGARYPDHPFVLGHWIGFQASRGQTGQAVSLQRRVLAASSGDAAALRNLVALLLEHARVRAAAGDAAAACDAAREASGLVPGVAPVAARAAELCGR